MKTKENKDSKVIAEFKALNESTLSISEEKKAKIVEMIATNPSYKNIMNNLKETYENFLFHSILNLQNKEVLTWKQKANKLEELNKQLSEDCTNKCALINLQKEQITELKKKLEFVSASEEKANNQLNELKNSIEKLALELTQAKLREVALSKLLKRSSFLCKCNDFKTINETFHSSNMEVNVNKSKTNIVIPKLDFSKLPRKKKADIKIVQCEPNSISESIEECSELDKITFNKEEMEDAKEDLESLINYNI